MKFLQYYTDNKTKFGELDEFQQTKVLRMCGILIAWHCCSSICILQLSIMLKLSDNVDGLYVL